MKTPLFKPELYSHEGTVAYPDTPALKGGRCTACGHVFFPQQVYGCEICGADGTALQAHPLAGKGQLEALAVVHTHTRPGRTAPFTIVAVRLEDGVLVRTLLANGVTPDSVARGATLCATLEEVTVQGSGGPAVAYDLRFAPSTGSV